LDVAEKLLDLHQFFWHWKLGKPLVGWFFSGDFEADGDLAATNEDLVIVRWSDGT
jgi:hypothetical protein